MRLRPRILALLAALSACESGSEPEPIEVIGRIVYEVEGGFCGGACPHERMYRSHDRVQLLVSVDDEWEREVFATLAPELVEDIEALSSGFAEGTSELGTIDPSCSGTADLPYVTLHLGGLSLTYARGCPPSGLVELDERYAELLALVSTCESSPLLLACDLGVF